jgi:hypothetical protein
MAPPVWAVLLKKLHSLTVTLLPLADTAPPTPFKTLKFSQFRNVMPEMDTEVFIMEKIGPDDEDRVQSNTVVPFEPVMLTNGTLPLMITLDSLKYPVERYTVFAFRD